MNGKFAGGFAQLASLPSTYRWRFMVNDQADLSIVVGGASKDVEGQEFVGAMRDALELLAELDRSISGIEQGTIVWEVVDAHTSSPLTLTLRGRSTGAASFAPQVIDACLDGLEALAAGSPLPPSFNRPAEVRLLRLVSRYKSGLGGLQLFKQGRTVAVTEAMLANIQRPRLAVASKPARRRREYGEVEGNVETVSSHESYYFNLWELISKRRVKCTFNQELRETVRAAWEKRAVVRGFIAFGDDGLPVSVQVDGVALKPESQQCPLFKTEGIDVTGGVESSAYVRALRDDD